MSEHTKGPWIWMEEEITGWARLSPGILLTDSNDGTPYGDAIDRANAKLIAAAPDLLDAAKLFVAYDSAADDGYSDVALMLAYAKAKEAILAAIAKATGAA